MTIRERIEQEARERYPDAREHVSPPMRENFNAIMNVVRAAYVEGKLSMVDEIEKAWDMSRHRKDWEDSDYLDRMRYETEPPTKEQYIDNLFKK